MGKNELLDDTNLKEFGKDYVKILTIFLKNSRPHKKVASGALINSLNSKVVATAKKIQLIIEGNDYLENVDQGRKKGKYPPIRAISKWARIKGIPQSAVFPIARKIFKFGIKPTNVIDKTIKEILTSPTLNRKYENSLVENVENIIFNKLKQ